jgi:hypothetical protein
MGKQWPDNITSGPIRYGRADNFDGFYLADAMHGIPTFGSVSPTDPLTIRSQFVSVFNYLGQTEAIAAQLVHRWNAHETLVSLLAEASARLNDGLETADDLEPEWSKSDRELITRIRTALESVRETA